MNATITSQNTPEYLLIESRGVLTTKDDLFKYSQMVTDEILMSDFKQILVNELDIQFPLGLFNYYDLVVHYIKDLPDEMRFFKIAVVVATEYKETADFWETVCVNHGFNFFAFTTTQDAIDWLLS